MYGQAAPFGHGGIPTQSMWQPWHQQPGEFVGGPPPAAPAAAAGFFGDGGGGEFDGGWQQHHTQKQRGYTQHPYQNDAVREAEWGGGHPPGLEAAAAGYAAAAPDAMMVGADDSLRAVKDLPPCFQQLFPRFRCGGDSSMRPRRRHPQPAVKQRPCQAHTATAC